MHEISKKQINQSVNAALEDANVNKRFCPPGC